MITVSDISLRYGKDALFEDVNIQFTEGNCYGLIGANGAGKSTFLKILSGEISPSTGAIVLDKGKRLSHLEQDHFKYDEMTAIDVVMMGNPKLYEVMVEKNKIYSKENFTEEDGLLVGQLEAEFDDMDGWNAEANIQTLLNGLNVPENFHHELMKNIPSADKVKVLLAKALFGNPDILLLDEPTNHLDLKSRIWLEEFLINFRNTVIVVSHDRHFLNKVCTHVADIDYRKIKVYSGNYDFWYESSQLLLKQQKDVNKKKEDRIKELQEFIDRFSANASKSRQATSRKRSLEKIKLDEMTPSARRYPFIEFKVNRNLGNEVLFVDKISKTIDGVKVLDDVSFVVGPNEKVALVGLNEIAKTTLFEILAGKTKADEGSFRFGTTVQTAYFEKDHNYHFESEESIFDYLINYSKIKEVSHVRGFLGRLLFGGDDGFKSVDILSGGEKVRVLLAKMMLEEANTLMFDEPTNHLDMESITALNSGLERFTGALLMSSVDHQLIQTTANRLIEITEDGKSRELQIDYDTYMLS